MEVKCKKGPWWATNVFRMIKFNFYHRQTVLIILNYQYFFCQTTFLATHHIQVNWEVLPRLSNTVPILPYNEDRNWLKQKIHSKQPRLSLLMNQPSFCQDKWTFMCMMSIYINYLNPKIKCKTPVLGCWTQYHTTPVTAQKQTKTTLVLFH